MLAYHGNPQGMILFRKHLKRYLKNLPPTDPICSQMVTAKTVAEFEALLACLEEEFGRYSIYLLEQMEPELMNKICNQNSRPDYGEA